MKKQILFTLLLIAGAASTMFGQLFSVGVGLEQSIDILQTPINNNVRVYNVTGNGFTVYPAAYVNFKDNMSFAIQTGGGISFMSKNNSSGEVDRDLLYTFPIGARLNFGSASNTGKECERWGWWLGAGRQWRSAIQIHGTTTTDYTTYYGEVGGTMNATNPMAIGAYFRFGLGANQTYGMQLGLAFTFNKVTDEGCN